MIRKVRTLWLLIFFLGGGSPPALFAAPDTPTPTPTSSPSWTPSPTATWTATPTPVSACCQGVGALTGITGHPLNGSGMAVDYARHRLYVADFTGNDIQVFDADSGAPLTLFSALGTGNLSNPIDAALDGDGNLYVADLGNKAVEKFDPNFNFICSIGQALGDGVAGVWADNGSVYFSTTQNFIYGYAGSGAAYSLAATFGGPSQLSHPNELVKVGTGLYVADTFNGRVVRYDTTHPAAAPAVVQASLFFPTGLREDLAGNFYVGESDNGGVAQFLDRFDPAFAIRESQCPLADVWGPAINAEGQVFVSGLNSFAVTEVAGCVSEPTLTPTPSYQGPNPPTLGGCFIYPSPARVGGTAHLVYTLAGPASVKMTVWNEAAEEVAEVTDRKGAGHQSTAFSLAGFAPGVYFYGLTLVDDGGRTRTFAPQKFAVIR